MDVPWQRLQYTESSDTRIKMSSYAALYLWWCGYCSIDTLIAYHENLCSRFYFIFLHDIPMILAFSGRFIGPLVQFVIFVSSFQ